MNFSLPELAGATGEEKVRRSCLSAGTEPRIALIEQRIAVLRVLGERPTGRGMQGYEARLLATPLAA